MQRLEVAASGLLALDRLEQRLEVAGPEVDPAALAYEVTAFITLEIRQAAATIP